MRSAEEQDRRATGPWLQRFRHRPPRLSAIYSSTNPVWFVTFCTHQRQPWLASAAVHLAFISFAERAASEFNIAIGRYVIMPDHVHLFVRGGAEFRLDRWIGGLKQALARAAQRSRVDGQIWQEGFFDHLLRNDESMSQKWNYIEQNPVRAGLVMRAADWPYQGEIVPVDRA